MTALAVAPPRADRARVSPELSRVAVLLGLSIFINYIDRGTLSIAAPLVKEELHLSASQLGILLSSFFWTYATFQIVSGWLVDRANPNGFLALGVFIWSAATVGTGFVHGFGLLLAVRLILGIGESVCYPSYNKIIAKHYSESNRGRANAAIAAGYACGPAFGTLLGGMLMARAGWRLFFIVLGLASLVWLLPWIKYMPRDARLSASRSSRPARVLEILRQRSAWGTFAGLFSFNYLLYFLITWLPFYLVHERQFSIQTMSLVGGAAFFATALSALVFGWVSDRWIAAGATLTRVRKTFTGTGPVIASSIVLVSVIPDSRFAMALLIVVCISLGICSSNLWALTQTLAGPDTAGRWTGLQNFVGNLAGVVAPALTGIVVDRTGHFFWAFVITSIVALLGAVAWIFVVGPIRPVAWTSHAYVGETNSRIGSA
jgi:ACS family D-galactonate transporter-like MFS transporter